MTNPKTTTVKSKAKPDPATLNEDGQLIIWFDDFNEDLGKEPMNNYRWLSNFYVGEPIVISGVDYGNEFEPIEFMTGEHAFQAFKAMNVRDFFEIVNCANPSNSKAVGRTITLRPDWEWIKLDVMAAVVRAKFTLARQEGIWLLGTDDALLIEGTFWNDDVWGVKLNVKEHPGRNWLGTLLMARRAELRAEQLFGKTHLTGGHNIDWVLS